jgi:hypothetical protein
VASCRISQYDDRAFSLASPRTPILAVLTNFMNNANDTGIDFPPANVA